MTETSAMRTMTHSSPRGDTSFKVGLGLIIAFAAAEVFFAGYYYVGRVRTRNAIQVPPPPAVARATAAPVTTAAPTSAPVAATAAPTSAPVAATAPPPVVAGTAAASSVALSADERLLREATELNNRGDTANALNRLQQAAEKNPGNAQVLAQMATIYESTGQADRSNQLWRKVHDIGPSAGSVYELADARLKRTTVATPAPAAVQATPMDAPATPAPAAPVEGIPDGSTFGIAEVAATETPDPDSDTNLMLRISVKKRPNAVVDHTKVKIQVFFYDTINDRDIKLTDAEVNYEWLTPDHDWAGAKPEVLAVTYVRPKNRAKTEEAALSEAAAGINPNRKKQPVRPPAPSTDGTRKYLGYIVRIYYNDKLQAVRADPTKLLNLFPPPSTATSP